MKKIIQTIACAACISIFSGTILAEDASAQRNKVRNFIKQKNLQVQDLPRGRFKDRFERLSRRGKDRAMRNLRKLHFTERDLDNLKIDTDGELHYADSHYVQHGISFAADDEVALIDSDIDVFALASRPESAHTIFLDFDGQIIENTRWNSTYGADSWSAKPYDRDGNPGNFSDTERAEIFEIWRRVAEDFKPFDVNVTTREPATFGSKTLTALVTGNMDAYNVPMPASHAGGVAWVNVWGRYNLQHFQPALVYTFSSAANTALAVSHELGHNLGLSHDGTSSTGYYRGHGTGTETWGPIMGAPYNRSLTQWSRGDYADANNTQDDIAEIGDRLGMVGDDHSTDMNASTALSVDADGTVSATRPDSDVNNEHDVNKGIIGHAGDADTFSFESYGGNAVLKIGRLREQDTTASNLDLIATLYDTYGNVLDRRGARPGEDIELNAYIGQGAHYVSVIGVGNSSVPYSNYGSLGQYFISGFVPADASVEEPEEPNNGDDTPTDPTPDPEPDPEPEIEPDMCPNSVFDDGMMWSGDLNYVKNACANEGQHCPNTWFYGPYKRIDAQCVSGAWTQIAN